jgi:Zn-finger nucleic acid-binding protein
VNCLSRGGSMRLEPAQECLVCNSRGNIAFPEPNQDGVRVLGEPSTTACPVFRLPPKEAALAGHRILYCERCRGMLVSIDDFLAIVEQRRVDCPECGEPMDTHPCGGPGNIVIDNCPHCRLNWPDHHELSHIARAADTTDPAGWRDPLPQYCSLSLCGAVPLDCGPTPTSALPSRQQRPDQGVRRGSGEPPHESVPVAAFAVSEQYCR